MRKVQPYSPSLALSNSLALAMHNFGAVVASISSEKDENGLYWNKKNRRIV